MAAVGVRRIILLSIDDLRFDALSCEQDTRYLRRYGLEGTRSTPTLDGIAAGGVRIRQAIAAAPYTPASHASLLTGCYPPRHGVRAFLRNGLSPSVTTIAERLRAAGFRTIGAVDFHELFDLVGLSRGFEQVIRADDRALWEALESRSDDRLFLFVHFVDVHPPYGESLCPPHDSYNDDAYDDEERIAQVLGLAHFLPPDRARSDLVALSNHVRRYCEDRAIADTIQFPRYLRGVNKFDAGRLRGFLGRLRSLGMLDGVLLIITSDHGQAPLPSWRRANRRIPQKFDHGEALIEELIRVPLIFSAPGRLPAGRVLDVQVSLVDLAPTILAWAGVPCSPEAVDGVSLVEVLEGGRQSSPAEAYSEVWYHDRVELSAFLKRSVAARRILEDGYETFLFQASLRTPRYKYVQTGCDLDADEMALGDECFARRAIRKVLGHVEEPEEVRRAVAALEEGRPRAALIAEFRDRHLHRRSLFDLLRDPYEEVNLLGLDLTQRALNGHGEFAATADQLEKALRKAQDHAPVYADQAAGTEADLEKVSERLRLLGYID